MNSEKIGRDNYSLATKEITSLSNGKESRVHLLLVHKCSSCAFQMSLHERLLYDFYVFYDKRQTECSNTNIMQDPARSLLDGTYGYHSTVALSARPDT